MVMDPIGQDATVQNLQESQLDVPVDGNREEFASPASSQTTIPVMASSARLSIEKIDKGERPGTPTDDENDEQDITRVEEEEPSGGLQQEELERARRRTKLQSIMLVATLTIGMIVNVSQIPMIAES